MSDFPEGTDWWKASDGRWYPPSTHGVGAGDAAQGTAGAPPPPPATTSTGTQPAARGQLGCFVAVLLVAGGCVAISVAGSDEAEDDNLRFGAIDVCEQFVSEQLRSPGSADFQDADVARVIAVGDDFTYSAFVDSQNGFGAELRTRFRCVVRHAGGDRFTLIDLDIG